MSVFRNLIKINKILNSHSFKVTKCCLKQTSIETDIIYRQPYFMNRSFSTCSALQTKQNHDSTALDLEHIYTGSLTDKMKAVKIFSLATSATGLAIQPILIEQGAQIGGTGMVVFLCTFTGFFTFITPVLLHFVAKKYVTEMHYNRLEDEYIATTISFFLRKKLIKFKVADVRVPDIAAMFTTFNVGKHSLFIEPTLFPDTKHYVKIMGYDKPMDFKFEVTEKKATGQEK